MSKSYLKEYIEKTKSGEILIGIELKQMLARLEQDFINPKYRFKPEIAQVRINFVERYCKHFISPYAGKPFIYSLYQKAFREALFGFQMQIDGTWVRRFNRALLMVGRKNGKSSECAGDGLSEFFCGNEGTQILCASNDLAQCGIVFEAINNMREASIFLEKLTRKNNTGIYMGNPKTKLKSGKFSYRNKATVKKLSKGTGAKEGRNIDFAIIDEIHEMKDNGLVTPITQSTSTKDECTIIEITTEGIVRDGYLDALLERARRSLNGEIETERWLIWIYTQDSEEEVWQDKKTWVKSNPNLGVSKKWRYLEDNVNLAKQSKADRVLILTKDFNIRQNSTTAWLDYEDVNIESTFNLEDFKDWIYVSGNDFAETTDLCATDILFYNPKTKEKYFWSHYWIPELKVDDKIRNPEDKDWRSWEKQNLITIVDGSSVDVSIVADYHWMLYEKYNMLPLKIGYDSRYANDFKTQIIKNFGDADDILVNIPQVASVLNNPMRTLEADLKTRKVNYNNNPISKWCFLNTGFKINDLGEMLPCKDKLQTSRRIDGTASKIIAYAALERVKSEYNARIEGKVTQNKNY